MDAYHLQSDETLLNLLPKPPLIGSIGHDEGGASPGSSRSCARSRVRPARELDCLPMAAGRFPDSISPLPTTPAHFALFSQSFRPAFGPPKTADRALHSKIPRIQDFHFPEQSILPTPRRPLNSPLPSFLPNQYISNPPSFYQPPSQHPSPPASPQQSAR